MEYERKISKHQNFSTEVEYFPAWEDFLDFRLVAKADWEIIIDYLSNLSLKFGVIDRYDSTPNGVNANNIDYSAVLHWKF